MARRDRGEVGDCQHVAKVGHASVRTVAVLARSAVVYYILVPAVVLLVRMCGLDHECGLVCVDIITKQFADHPQQPSVPHMHLAGGVQRVHVVDVGDAPWVERIARGIGALDPLCGPVPRRTPRGAADGDPLCPRGGELQRARRLCRALEQRRSGSALLLDLFSREEPPLDHVSQLPKLLSFRLRERGVSAWRTREERVVRHLRAMALRVRRHRFVLGLPSRSVGGGLGRLFLRAGGPRRSLS